jgi:hypothetical protein
MLRPRQRRLLLTAIGALSFFSCAYGFGDAHAQDAPPAAEAPWSATVGGLQARLILAPREIQHGTPLVSVRLELRDVRGVLGSLFVPWTKVELKWRVDDAAGNRVPKTGSVAWSGQRAPPADLVLPAGATLSFELTDRGRRAVAGQAAMIDFGPFNVFLIPRDGDYFLSGSMTVWVPFGFGEAGNWDGSIVFPAVRIPVRSDARVISANASAIDALGAKMLDRRNWQAADDALRALSLIDDVRVVPWYLEALREASTLVVPRALDGLSRFDSDPALEGIRSVMTSEDGNVRHTAAIALSLSPHAEAKRLLWTMIDDPRQALRMVVVRAAGEADSEATAVLEHAVDDPDATVSATARALLGRETTRR